MKGYIKLHRKLLKNPLMKKPSWAWLWVVLLLMTNHKDTEFIFNNKVVKLKAGQFLTGRKQLAKNSGLPETTIERILEFLESEHQIGQQKTSKHRIITIIKWEEYQSRENDYEKMDNKWTTNGQQMDTYKNDKNDKNITSEQSSRKKTTKKSKKTIKGEDTNKILSEFYKLNKQVNFASKTDRKAVNDLIKTYGLDKLTNMVKHYILLLGTDKFMPVATTPYMFKKKLAQIQVRFNNLNK